MHLLPAEKRCAPAQQRLPQRNFACGDRCPVVQCRDRSRQASRPHNGPEPRGASGATGSFGPNHSFQSHTNLVATEPAAHVARLTGGQIFVQPGSTCYPDTVRVEGSPASPRKLAIPASPVSKSGLSLVMCTPFTHPIRCFTFLLLLWTLPESSSGQPDDSVTISGPQESSVRIPTTADGIRFGLRGNPAAGHRLDRPAPGPALRRPKTLLCQVPPDGLHLLSGCKTRVRLSGRLTPENDAQRSQSACPVA